MKKFNKILFSLILLFSFNSNVFAETGEATEYGVTMSYLEMCTGLTTASNKTTCDNAAVIGSGYSKYANIASVNAGATAAQYGDLGLAVAGVTYTHMQVTMSRLFRITGSTANCVTAAGQPADLTDANGFVAGASKGGTPASRDIAANVTTGASTAVNSINAGDGTGTRQNDQVIAQNDTHLQWRGALSRPWTAGGEYPTIKIAFDTSTALGSTSNCANQWAEEPGVTITIE